MGADISVDSIDGFAADCSADLAIRDVSALSDRSTGIKRCPSGFTDVTDDGFEESPTADAKRVKRGMGNIAHGTSFSEESYQEPMPDARVDALANQMYTMVQVMPVWYVSMTQYLNMVSSGLPQGTALPSEAASDVLPQVTITKRENELVKIRGESLLPQHVIDATPLGSVEYLTLILKRKWEKAKEQYRTNLKVCSLKSQTQEKYSVDEIKEALNEVHEPKMKPPQHVERALALLAWRRRRAKCLHSMTTSTH